MLSCLGERMFPIIPKSKTIQQVFTLSLADRIKGSVKLLVRFLCNISPCGIGHIGIGDKQHIPWDTDPIEVKKETFYILMGFVIDKN